MSIATFATVRDTILAAAREARDIGYILAVESAEELRAEWLDVARIVATLPAATPASEPPTLPAVRDALPLVLGLRLSHSRFVMLSYEALYAIGDDPALGERIAEGVRAATVEMLQPGRVAYALLASRRDGGELVTSERRASVAEVVA